MHIGWNKIWILFSLISSESRMRNHESVKGNVGNKREKKYETKSLLEGTESRVITNEI